MAVSLYDYNEGQSDLSILVSRVYNIQEEKSLESQDQQNQYKITKSSLLNPKMSSSTENGNKTRFSASDKDALIVKKLNNSPRKSIISKNNVFENITEEDEESYNSTNTKYNDLEEYADNIYDEYLNSKNSRHSQRSRKLNNLQDRKNNDHQLMYLNNDGGSSLGSENQLENQLEYHKNNLESQRFLKSSNPIFQKNRKPKDFRVSKISEKRIQNYLDFEDDDDNLAKLSSSDIDDILRRISPISRKLHNRIAENDNSTFQPQLEIAKLKGKRLSFDETDSDTTEDTDIYSNHNDSLYNSKSSSLKTSHSSGHARKQQFVTDNLAVRDTKLKNNLELSDNELDEDDKEIALMLRNAHIGHTGKHKKRIPNMYKSKNYLLDNDMDIGYDSIIDKQKTQRNYMKTKFNQKEKTTSVISNSSNRPKTIFDELSNDECSNDDIEDSLLENCFEKEYYDTKNQTYSSKISSETKEIIERMKTIRSSENGKHILEDDNTKKLNNNEESHNRSKKSDKHDRKLNTGISTNTSISILKQDEIESHNAEKSKDFTESPLPKSLKISDDTSKINNKYETIHNGIPNVLNTFATEGQENKSHQEELKLTPTRKTRFERYSNDKVRSTSPVRDLINKHIDTINRQNAVGTLESAPKLSNNTSKNIMRSPRSINSIASKFESNINQQNINLSGNNASEHFVIPRPDSATAISATNPNRREPLTNFQSKKNTSGSLELKAIGKTNSDTNGGGMKGINQRIPHMIQNPEAGNLRSDLKTNINKEIKPRQKIEQQQPSSPKKAISDIKNKFDNLIQRFQKKDIATKDSVVEKDIIIKKDSAMVLSSPTAESNSIVKEPISPLQQSNLFDEEPDFAKVMEKNKFRLKSSSPVADRRKLFEMPEEAQFKENQRRILKSKN